MAAEPPRERIRYEIQECAFRPGRDADGPGGGDHQRADARPAAAGAAGEPPGGAVRVHRAAAHLLTLGLFREA